MDVVKGYCVLCNVVEKMVIYISSVRYYVWVLYLFFLLLLVDGFELNDYIVDCYL